MTHTESNALALHCFWEALTEEIQGQHLGLFNALKVCDTFDLVKGGGVVVYVPTEWDLATIQRNRGLLDEVLSARSRKFWMRFVFSPRGEKG